MQSPFVQEINWTQEEGGNEKRLNLGKGAKDTFRYCPGSEKDCGVCLLDSVQHHGSLFFELKLRLPRVQLFRILYHQTSVFSGYFLEFSGFFYENFWIFWKF